MKKYFFVSMIAIFTSAANAAPLKPVTLAEEYPYLTAGAAICQAFLMRSFSGGDPICQTAMSDFALAFVIPKAIGLTNMQSAAALLIGVPFTGGPSGTLASPALSHIYSANINHTLPKIINATNGTVFGPYTKTIAWAIPLIATAAPALLYNGKYVDLKGQVVKRLAQKSGYILLSSLGQFREDLNVTQFDYATYLAALGGGLYTLTGDTWLGYQAARYAMYGAGYELAEVALSDISKHANNPYIDLAVSTAVAIVTSKIALRNGGDLTMFDQFKLGIALSGFFRATAAVMQLPSTIGLMVLVGIEGLTIQRYYARRA